MKNQIGNYIYHILHLTPSQIKSFGKSYIVPQDFSNLKNKKEFKVFLTKTQIKKLDKAKANKEKVDLKFSKTQFKKTLPYVSRLNHSLKTKNAKKLKLQDRLETLKTKNAKKAKKLKKLKINYNTFTKNTLKKYKGNPYKPPRSWNPIHGPNLELIHEALNKFKSRKKKPNSKKSIWDVVVLPKMYKI